MRLHFLLAFGFRSARKFCPSRKRAAKSSTATINGTVSDPSGAAIAGATIIGCRRSDSLDQPHRRHAKRRRRQVFD